VCSYLAESEPSATPGSTLESPQQIGRYRVVTLLGEGGFGRVFLAQDEQLQRPVAIKVPHRKLVSRPEDADAYLSEARTVANLDHPNIVPVYDVGSTEECPCFIVSKFIEGSNLKKRIREGKPSVREAVELVATVAEILHHAHKQGIVHRDIKPGNILLDTSGKPYVADFGLALTEEYAGHGLKYAGTPAYMSPEQARGEGHRVDGRSDIFSMGVVFYELLVGRQPFRADSRAELLELITTVEPRPLRQIDEDIPKELERICFKALSKRAPERYLTGKDMAEDLRHFLAQQTASSPTSVSPQARPLVATEAAMPVGSVSGSTTDLGSGSSSDSLPLKIVPKGLRSFDAHDADFFLELLPGPRDREGLPESIRFWKSRIEETDPDNTFAVGLIYGPSGCGKSSLVKAGLLPRLSDEVLALYVEVTAEETESRLLSGLRKRCPALSAHLGLKGTLAALRRGEGLPAGKKVLIVLDQFEQWLHARKDEENTELVQALRQCDGARVQCVVLVRDDFWMAATRFMRELEIRLVEGHNSAAVDLFPLHHAEKVLAAFGRAFGVLPERGGEVTKDQKRFLQQAIQGLAQEGKIVCVRLALFAEMMKSKPWTPASLQAVGGTEGVGVTFLEETFSSATAPPEHRYHQKAARAVLKALLPETGSDIKGHLRSDAELRAASGYASRPRDFEDLIRILDSELRLLTPTEPEGSVAASGSLASQPTSEAACGYEAGQKYYQLTHDYLVPSLRDWLTRKQKETRRGRAELLLADRASVWNARPENRQLPSLLQYLSIRFWTHKKNWTAPERKMMRKATRYHVVRSLTVLLVLLLVGWGSWEGFGRVKAQTLTRQLLISTTDEVLGIVDDMAPYRRWIDPLLRDIYTEAEINNDPRTRLHASLALLPVDPGQVEYLYYRLFNGEAQEVAVIRQALLPHKDELTRRLWAVLEDRQNDQVLRFRAACALAEYAPDDSRWEKVGGDVAEKLITENAVTIGKWADLLQPVGKFMLPPLAAFLEDEQRSESTRRTIASLYSTFADRQTDDFARLENCLMERCEKGASEEVRVSFAKRQANVGVALVAMGRGGKVLPLLKHSPDPTVRSYLIERLGPGGASIKMLTVCLAQEMEQEIDVSVRRAAILALGAFDLERLPLAERRRLFPLLLHLYRNDPDAGVHGSAEWLLRQWGQQNKLQDIDKGLATGQVEGNRQWYINRQGQTMVIVPRPGVFVMGEGKEMHKRRIDRKFAIASKEVTVGQFLRFRKDHPYIKAHAPTGDCPVNKVSWYDAAEYCNWLSKQEGIPEDQWCYLPNGKGEYAEGMKPAPDYLRRTGYRLPSEAEWEYACRAGALTPWAFGQSEELLGKYAWYFGNSPSRTRPVGLLKPNDLGLFDMHGNATEWCQDRYGSYIQAKGGEVLEDIENTEDVKNKDSRMLRGGSFFTLATNVRSPQRIHSRPWSRINDSGLRVARTFR
jgi:serine/threonine protein kinase/formylglycine-generating enzyme required for sulfatase activity